MFEISLLILTLVYFLLLFLKHWLFIFLDIIKLSFKDHEIITCNVHFFRNSSTTELEKDLKQLESGLEFIQKEVEWHKNKSAGAASSSTDRFARAMKEFLAVAVDTLSDVRSQYDEMTKLVRKHYKITKN